MVPLVQIGQGEIKSPAVSRFGQLVYYRPARITKTVMLGNFVKGLPHRVVDSRTQNRNIVKIIGPTDNAVSPGHQQTQKRIFDICVFQPGRVKVGQHVINRDKRYVPCPGKSFGKTQAHQQCPQKAGMGGSGNGVYIGDFDLGFVQSFLHHADYPFGVFP